MAKRNLSYALLHLSYALLLSVALICTVTLRATAQTEAAADIDPVKIFEQGQDAHQRGDLEAALKFYDAALLAQPGFPEAEYQRGTALVSLKRRAEAEKAFRQAIELRRDWSLPYVALGNLLLHSRQGDLTVGLTTPEEAEGERLLTRSIELDPENFDALVTLSDLRSRRGNMPGALALLRRATANPKAGAPLWMTRAEVEREMKEIKAALASAEQALKLDPRDASARTFRAELLIDSGDMPQALTEMRAAAEELLKVSAQPDARAAAIRQRLANLYARLGEESRLANAQMSLDHFRRAAELAPANADYATGYAAALVQARRFQEAVEILRRVIVAAPETYAAHANLAAALDELKRYPEALVEYRWLRAKRPDIAVTDFFIARAYDMLEQYPEALVAYEAFLARADKAQNGLEIERVNLRLPSLRRQAQRKK